MPLSTVIADRLDGLTVNTRRSCGRSRDARRSARSRVQAQLSVRNCRAAIEFYKSAFGAVELYRFGGTDELEEVVAQLAVGSSVFWARTSRRSTATSVPRPSAVQRCECCSWSMIRNQWRIGRWRPARLKSTRWARSTAGDWGGSMIRLAIDGRSASRSTGGRQLDSVLPHDHVPCWDGGWLAGNGPTHTSRLMRCFRRSRCRRGNRPVSCWRSPSCATPGFPSGGVTGPMVSNFATQYRVRSR
jgi:hypothetical protein